MPEIIFAGPDGRLEGRYQPPPRVRAPVALILPPHPGTMNHPIAHALFKTFVNRGFATMRFNFRGVGKSQGEFDNGIGELSDATAALDWMQQFNHEAPITWVAGFGFGALIGMQLLMRRPEIKGFISIAPPANLYDFGLPGPLPLVGPDRARVARRGGDGAGRPEAGRQAQDPASHRHRLRRDRRRQPFLRA